MMRRTVRSLVALTLGVFAVACVRTQSAPAGAPASAPEARAAAGDPKKGVVDPDEATRRDADDPEPEPSSEVAIVAAPPPSETPRTCASSEGAVPRGYRIDDGRWNEIEEALAHEDAPTLRSLLSGTLARVSLSAPLGHAEGHWVYPLDDGGWTLIEGASVTVLAQDGSLSSDSVCTAGFVDIVCFWTAMQGALERGDARRMADAVAYPLRVNGKRTWYVKNPAQFLKAFSQIFPLALRRRIATLDAKEAFCNEMGTMLGAGVLWSSDSHLALRAINQ